MATGARPSKQPLKEGGDSKQPFGPVFAHAPLTLEPPLTAIKRKKLSRCRELASTRLIVDMPHRSRAEKLGPSIDCQTSARSIDSAEELDYRLVRCRKDVMPKPPRRWHPVSSALRWR